MNASTISTRRELLLERAQSERNELISMVATARALSPRVQAWARAARTFCRLLRVLVARARHATGGR